MRTIVSSFLLGLIFLGVNPLSAQKFPVEKIRPNVPGELVNDTLIVAAFDLVEPEPGMAGPRRQQMIRINKAAKEANQTLFKFMTKHYPYPFKLVPLKYIPGFKADGYKWFLDMVVMPKQMKAPEPMALIPAYERHRSANRMYNHRNAMWHYYFYVRDLQNDDAYISRKFKGKGVMYDALKHYLRQIVTETTP